MARNFDNLRDHVLPMSLASDFDTAKLEWKLVDVQLRDEFDACPCGHRIKELCYIENRNNGNRTYVGNVCINKFIGIETGNLFAGLKRIAADDMANANEDLIEHAYELGYIFEKEYKFLMDTRLTKKLSGKQLAWKQKINLRIINKTVVR